ncbi:UbiA family prenyltransferase [Hyphomicrobium sp. NDB2Meth4]|uniref:UbiA family prenyltransferase n=1 Tax=Hyphomicrobium sp. NDB2Meth4 TaxID=1892846 RepID=UPI0009310A5F|nr:UbiA family prenyltransferase [Hyphomicrobium sp. NDB2Meth4]
MGSLATRRMSGWRTALKLGRVSNLPTIWSNVIAGSALAGGAPTHWLLMMAVAISAMYVAGMFLNDAFDRNIDARERPERPIPSGEASADAVIVVGASLLVVGVVGLATVNDHTGLVGLALAGAILLYDWQHKGNPFAPFVMGLCRALVYIAAASAALTTLSPTVLLPAAAMLLYVAGLTYTARQENLDRVTNLWPLPLLAAPAGVSLVGTDFSLIATVSFIALAVCALRVGQLLKRRHAGDVSRAVGLMIAAISINDALFATTTGMDYAAIACLACFILTLVFQRYVPAS